MINADASYTPAISFQAVSFYDRKQERQIVLLYALGKDGIIREYTGPDHGWKGFPIEDHRTDSKLQRQ